MNELNKNNFGLTQVTDNDITLLSDIKPPDENGYNEFAVTLKEHEDLDNFYDDMETPGGTEYIPDRAVPVVERLPSSRNTVYRLSESEAKQIVSDPRVLEVDLTAQEKGIKYKTHRVISSSNFDKSQAAGSTMINWGLYRCVTGNTVSGWGNDKSSVGWSSNNLSGAVSTTSTGKYVDVVIVDAQINPDHPEFAVNADGTGGTRVIQYNWFQHNLQVTGNPPTSYVYRSELYGDHAHHVAGTVAGNSQGWASSANIYTINFDTDPYNYPSAQLGTKALQYVKQFHLNKPINPITGRKNPTVCCNSWGPSPIGLSFSAANTSQFPSPTVTSYTYAGNTYNTSRWGILQWAFPSTYTSPSIAGSGLYIAFTGSSWFLGWAPTDAAGNADVVDALNSGVVVIGSAGNDSSVILNRKSSSSTSHYNDIALYAGVTTYYPRRGMYWAAYGNTSNAIMVGSCSTQIKEGKDYFSNTGDRIDIWAPGSNIMSAWCYLSNTGSVISNTANLEAASCVAVTDPRNPSYYLNKDSGTSMSCPQVAGVAACILETYPNWNSANIINYLSATGTTGQLANTGIFEGYASYFNLNASPNLFLKYNKERQDSGNMWPKENTNLRPSQGQLFPRPRIYQI